MISATLQLVKRELQEFFQSQFPSEAFAVLAGKLVNREGKSMHQKNIHQVVITLLNVQEERTMQQSRTSDQNQPYYLNLLLLFSVQVKESDTTEQDYLEGLAYLDAILKYFQQYPTFTAQSHPGLPNGIQHLQFNLSSEDLRENSYIWTMTGAKHVPSVLYQVRSVMVGQNYPGLLTRVPSFMQ